MVTDALWRLQWSPSPWWKASHASAARIVAATCSVKALDPPLPCVDRYVFKDDGSCGEMVHLTAVFSPQSAVSTVHPPVYALRKLLKCENAVHALGKSLKCENAVHALGKSLKCENAAHALRKSLKCENAASSCLEEITEV